MRRLAVGTLITALIAVAPSSAVAAPAKQTTAVGTGGAVASMDVDASKAGIEVLRRGGNAVDATVATASALGVTIPFVAGPGGGGFMVIYNARTHQVTTIDGRENCPAACTSTMFIDPATGQPMNYTTASDQPLSTGVPGPRRFPCTGTTAWPPTCSRPSPSRGAASGSTSTSPSSSSRGCPCSRPTRPAASCC
jgi:gamma-glutamyltranspeptidase/glutathione hydrolase